MDIRERITRNETRIVTIEEKINDGEAFIKQIIASKGFSLKKIGIILAVITALLGGVTWAQNAYFQDQNDKRYVRPYQIAGQITQGGLEHTLDERELQKISDEITFLQDKKKYVSSEFTTADEFRLGRLIETKIELENKLYRGRQ